MAPNQGELSADAREAVVGSSLAAANRVIVRTATVFCGAWILGLVPAILSADSGLRSTTLAVAMLAVVLLTWFLTLIIEMLPHLVLVIVLAATVIALSLDTYPNALAGPYAALVPWINLAVLMAALLTAPPLSLWLVSAISASGFVVSISVAALTGEFAASWRGCVLVGAYPVAVGMAAYGTARALRVVARADDEAEAQRLAALAEEERELAGRNERFRISRLLHDTVINTFGAIREGAPGASPDRIAQRCAHDLQVLQAAATLDPGDPAAEPGRMPLDVAAPARRRGEVLGLSLTVDATGALPFAPPDVAEAVLGAVDEALLNVSKHAGTEHVDLRIDSTADSFAIRIRDGGHSFRTRPEGSDGGPASITARCARVGVAASIDHNPGGGADVRIMWSAAPSDPVENLATAPALLQSLIPAARWFSMWLIGLFTVNTLIVLGSEPITGSLLALVLLVVAIGAALTFGSRAVPIPWSAAALLTACAAAVAVLPASGSTGCSKIGIGWWGSLGGTMCVVFLVLLSGQVRWLVAGTLSYLAGIAFLSLQIVQVSSDCVAGSMPSIIATDAAWVAAMVLFRRFLVHYGDQAQRSQQLAAATEQRVVAMREHERIRVANLQTVLATIRPLLFGLSNGSVSPQDPTIRRQCAEDEAYLRSLIRIDPDLGALGDELVDAVQAARSRGVALCVRSAEWVPDPAPQTLRAVASVLRRVVDVLGPGAEATVTLFAQPDLVTITILVPTSTPVIDPDTAYANGLSSGLRAAQIVDDDQVLIELEWDRPEGDVAMRVLAAHQ